MFGTKLGASAENAMDLYLRPETAQGIFVNFLNVQKTSRHKLPLGLLKLVKHLEMRLLQDNLFSE
jgi:glycyl-tRNA synthetase